MFQQVLKLNELTVLNDKPGGDFAHLICNAKGKTISDIWKLDCNHASAVEVNYFILFKKLSTLYTLYCMKTTCLWLNLPDC